MSGLIAKTYFRCGLVLVLCLGVAGFCFVLPKAKVAHEAGVVLRLPEVIPGFDSELVEMSEKEREWLPQTTEYLKRNYYPVGVDRGRVLPISLSLILSGGDERSLHRPSVCMDGQGWSIPAKTVREIIIDGKKIELMDLSLRRLVNGKILEAHYYFFWVGMGMSTPSYAKMKGLSLWDNFTKNLNHRWAYPGLFVYVYPGEENGHDRAWQRAQHVLEYTIPEFYKELGAEE